MKKKIFEGDIVLIPSGIGGDYHYDEVLAEVKYDKGEFYLHNKNDKYGIVHQYYNYDDVEVVGNIYD